MTYVIGKPCIDVMDRACVDECPVDCIYEGGRALYIHPDECVDCGACEPVCPVDAIYYEDDLPDNAGSFRGDISAASLRGFWVQPAGVVNATRYATPIHFVNAMLGWKHGRSPLRISYPAHSIHISDM